MLASSKSQFLDDWAVSKAPEKAGLDYLQSCVLP
jgi:hypothetical protein